MEKRNKKKLVYCLVLAVLVSITMVAVKKILLYKQYQYPNESFFGKELYSEITHTSSSYEKEIGMMIKTKIEEIAGCQGTEEDIPNMEDTDALEDFYYFTVKDAKTQEIKLKLITCIINGNEGHVWLDYSLVRYGENGKIVNSSNDILLLCYIEKQWGEWKVVQTKEAP